MRFMVCLLLGLCLLSLCSGSSAIPGYDERTAAIFKTSIEAFVEARSRSSEATAVSFIPAEAEPLLPFLHGLNRRPKIRPTKVGPQHYVR
jgi:hypothetical protein